MSDFDEKEQKNVRTALRFLRLRIGAWEPLAKALRYEMDSVEKMVNGRRAVTARMALRVARIAGVSIDDLLEGRYLQGACPHCGHGPDFGDEDTVVDDLPPIGSSGGLKAVKAVK